MYLCSICLNTYKNIEKAMLCCAVEINSDDEEVDSSVPQYELDHMNNNR